MEWMHVELTHESRVSMTILHNNANKESGKNKENNITEEENNTRKEINDSKNMINYLKSENI